MKQEDKSQKKQEIKNVIKYLTGHLTTWIILLTIFIFICIKLNINETVGMWIISVNFTILLILAIWSNS